jgi:MYXO-CTERM domain-containing protein
MKPLALAALSLTFGLSVPSHAVTLGQADTFESGTTEGWVINLLGIGNPPPEALPRNIADGGPAGSGDNFLRLTSVGGGGAGSRLVAINLGAWAGDYAGAGVTGIRMNLRNSGSTDLTLRLVFENPAGGPPTDIAVSTAGVALAAGGGWTSVLFPAVPSALTAQMGSVANALGTTTALRLFHGTDASFPGPALTAVLDVDNVTAVPEPATWALWAGGLLLLAARRRRAG